MSRVPLDIERLLYLSEAACDECISENELTELHTVLLADDAACRCYLDYYRLRVALRMELRAHQATRNVQQQIKNKAILPDSSGFCLMQVESPLPGPLGLLSTTIRGTLGYFSHEIPFSFLVGAVLTGLLVLVAWLVPVSNLKEHAKNSPSITSVNQRHFASDSKMEIVGKITGMVDCKWSAPDTETFRGANVLLGRKYALSSGLMEITYDTGAKVILQGPVTYVVESNGGYLSVGKLTGKLEKKVASGQWSVAGESDPKSQDPKSAKSEISSPQSVPPEPLLHYPLFTINTPTATVTDLGTEFGVDVDRQGGTQAHVLRGSVEMSIANAKGDESHKIILTERQAAQVEVGKDNVLVISETMPRLDAFRRQLPRRIRIPVFNTGVNVAEGQPDPHWQIVAVSDNPNFKPQPALVTRANSGWLDNDSHRSQWISIVADGSELPNGVTYTFRTTFELMGVLPEKARLTGGFIVDNHVQAIRLNGNDVPVPEHKRTFVGGRYDSYKEFTINRGFVEGMNVLEIKVENGGDPPQPANSPMGILVHLEVSAQEK